MSFREAEKPTSGQPDTAGKDVTNDDNSVVETERNESDASKLSDDLKAHSVGAGEVNYQNMHWMHVGLLMLAETVSLGILTLSWSVSKLGFIPGIILVFFSGLLATYTGYVYGQFKLAHPHVTDIASAAYVLGQALPWPYAAVVLREVVGFSAVLVLVFIQAAHIIGFAVMVHEINPKSGMCAIVWYFIGALIQLVLTLPRTMRNASYVSILSSISVLVAVIMVMANVGKRNSRGSDTLTYWKGPPGTEFSLAFTGVLNIVLSYTGHVAYLSFASELRDPRDFHKALFFQLSSATTLYTIVAAVIYYYVGSAVKAPALSSASENVKKAAYGVASLTIIAAGVVNGHVSSKYVYTRYFKSLMKKRTFKAWGIWVAIVVINWTVAWLMSELIPSFPHMLAIVSALFGAWFSYGISSLFWIHGNWTDLCAKPTVRKVLMAILNIAILLLGVGVSVAGLVASVQEMQKGHTGKIFSCKTNFT